jgi:hypothetical protein
VAVVPSSRRTLRGKLSVVATRSAVRWKFLVFVAVVVGAFLFMTVYFGAEPAFRSLSRAVHGTPQQHPYGSSGLLHMAALAGGVGALGVLLTGITAAIDSPRRRSS